MNIYFDNREGAHSYVTIFCDDERYGNVLADRDTIVLVEIPDGVNMLKISSVAVTDTFKGLKKEIIEDIDLCFEKEKMGEFGFKNEKWQYPYDAIIYLNGCNDDIFIYQCTFPQEELMYALGYRARRMSDGRQIETKYVKRIESFSASSFKWGRLLLACIACVLGIVLFPEGVESYRAAVKAGGGFGIEAAIGYCGLCIAGVLYFIIQIPQIIKYEGFLNESKLSLEYYLNENGEWN